MKKILVLDQGTTSTRAFIFDERAQVIAFAQEEFPQIYPEAGYVEHDPIDILSSVRSVISTAMTRARLKYSDIAGMGITNQRETVVMWNKVTGEPVHNAIVWQCRRAAKRCDEIRRFGLETTIRKKTGLRLDSYFSAAKIEWLLKNEPKAKLVLDENNLLVGTIDTYLMWQLSGGKIYKTDYTNASRTMLFNIHTLSWDKELCSLFHVPMEILPEVHPSSHYYGDTSADILGFKVPILAVAGDQQCALFGQSCFNKGDLKVTYGTGCFLLMNSKEEAITSNNGLITTLNCETKETPSYALEGSVFVGGALVQWLRDELQLIENAADSENIAKSVPDNNGVYIVPAFVGMGAPYWNFQAEGIITGLTRGTNRSHLVRAALEAICYEVNDVIMAMSKDLGKNLEHIMVDGGASVNSFLMQFQADISKAAIIRPKNTEVTALGACYLVGLEIGIWKSLEEIQNVNEIDQAFIPNLSDECRKRYICGWEKAIKKSFLK